MLLKSEVRVPTLVGHIKLAFDRTPVRADSNVDNVKSDAMMKTLLLICINLSTSSLFLEKIVRADFNIPNARWSCRHGHVGLALLQDADSRDQGEAVIHISGRANDPASAASVIQAQEELASAVYSMRSSLGIEAIDWS